MAAAQGRQPPPAENARTRTAASPVGRRARSVDRVNIRLKRGLAEPTMQPRESAPLWVGLTVALMIVGMVMYLTGYFMIEDFLALFK